MRLTKTSAAPLSLALIFTAGAAGAQIAPSPYPAFNDETPLELKISGPLRAIARDDIEEGQRTEFDTLIEWTEPDGRRLSQAIEMRIRGRSRTEVCDNRPPLSLDFPTDEVESTVFAGQERLKLVTLCNRGSQYADYLAQEFLIYKMFNVLTERSFRVRWATVEYVDTGRRNPRPTTEPAFLIEADWEVAERLDMQLVEPESIAPAALHPAHTALYSAFNYLIGNEDWALVQGASGEPCCHNGKVVRTADGMHIVLPYDFDNAGLINADYAVPNEILPIRFVTQRLFRGFCFNSAEHGPAVDRLNRERERLFALFDSELLGERGRTRSVRYLETSFEILGDPQQWQEEFDEDCRSTE